MISSGVNPRVVQQRLGHANVSITLSLYTRLLPGHDCEDCEDCEPQPVRTGDGGAT
jgi:site-specific recombinase XerD